MTPEEVTRLITKLSQKKAICEDNYALLTKKMEVANMEDDQQAIEKARQNLIAAFEASLDLAIEVGAASRQFRKMAQR